MLRMVRATAAIGSPQLREASVIARRRHLQDLVIQHSYPVQDQGGVTWWYAKTCSLELSADGNALEGTWLAPGASGGTMRLQRR